MCVGICKKAFKMFFCSLWFSILPFLFFTIWSREKTCRSETELFLCFITFCIAFLCIPFLLFTIFNCNFKDLCYV